MRDFNADNFNPAGAANDGGMGADAADLEPVDLELDALLRTAMAERSEVATSVDFAALVLATAPATVASPALTQTSASSASASAWSVWAAALAVAAVVAFGIWRLMALEASSTVDTTLASTVSTDTVSLLPIGGAVFLAAVVWAVARAALDSAEPNGVGSLA